MIILHYNVYYCTTVHFFFHLVPYIAQSSIDPSLVTYPIPANSSSGRTTNLICGVLSKAGELGLKRRLQKIKEYKKTLGMLPEETFGLIDEEIEDFENENPRRQRRN